MNIVLITVDALRFDHVTHRFMPNLFKHMKKTFKFTNALAGGPVTLSSITTLMTGRYFNSFESIEEKRENMLAYLLNTKGFNTLCVQSNIPLIVNEEFKKGFDIYEDTLIPYIGWDRKNKTTKLFEKFFTYYQGTPSIPAMDVTKKGIKLLKDRTDNKKIFLWLHYMDTHMPYYLKGNLNIFDKFKGHSMFKGKHNPEKMTKADIKYIKDAYKKEVERVDRGVGKLIEFLKSEKLWEDTLFIFTSDHGNAHGEHGRFFHPPDLLYDETVHIPLIIKHPDFKESSKIDQPIGLVDIKPTILDLVDIKSLKPMHGFSFKKCITHNKVIRDDILVFDRRENVALRNDRYKYILNKNSEDELYDLNRNPRELNNIASSNQEISNKLRNIINQKIKDIDGVNIQIDKSGYSNTDKIMRDRLKALGYID